MHPADAHDDEPVGAQKPQSEQADAHDAGRWGEKPTMQTVDAHDAMMLGMPGRKAQNGTS